MVRFAVLATLALAAPVSGAVAEEMGFIGIKFKWDSDKKVAEVLEAIPDSPAEKAGLKEGDVVTKINGKGSEDSEEFVKKVRAVKPGETLTLTVTRDGKEKEVKVKAAKVPENS
jgi:S1-C subfamily serine protease